MTLKFKIVDKKTGKRLSFLHFNVDTFFDESTMDLFFQLVKSEMDRLDSPRNGRCL